jgi:hypothetical protein
MDRSVEGGCLCGGLRYRLHEPPVRVGDCHCVDCRRASAAAFVTWGVVYRKDVEILSGDLRKVRYAGRLRSFAACCATPLFFQDAQDSTTIDVTVVSLDYPERFAPEVAIWTEDRLPWVTIDPHRRTFLQARKLSRKLPGSRGE